MNRYEKYILPRLVHLVCRQKDIELRRKKMIPEAVGSVLEIGMGSGLNMPFYRPDKIRHLWGVEPSGHLRRIADQAARESRIPLEWVSLYGEQIPLEQNSADTIVVTYALCTIPGVKQALSEMRRILKPGGQLLFCEHGRAPDNHIRQWQDRLTPCWMRVSGGCHLNRPIADLIRESGFQIQKMEKGYAGAVKVTSYNYTGTAVIR